MGQNTDLKYVCELEKRQIISTENKTVVTRDGLKRNSNLLTIRPIRQKLNRFYEQQLAQMDVAAKHQPVAQALTLRSDKERVAWRPVRRRVALLMNGR